jgi:asparagine synthase (glutamine-hydrolysing)
MRDGQWRQAWQACRAASRNNTYLRGSSPLKLWLLNAATAYLPGKLKPLARYLRGQRSPLAHSVINPAFAQKLQLVERIRIQQAAAVQPGYANLRQAHSGVISSPILGAVLGLTGYEHMAGRYGVELRDPWADRRVVEFFLNLPLRHKVRDGWTKYLVRSAFGAELETKVRQRLGKEHLGWHFASRLMRETQGFASQTLENDLEHTLGDYVDLNALSDRYQNFQTRGDDVDRDFFFGVMTLLLWLRRTVA